MNLEKNENNEVIMDIKVDAKEVNTAYDRTCKRVSQHVNIPGFRKGKAPNKTVEKHVGKEYIQREILDSILPRIISDVIRENKYDTVTEPSLENFNFEQDGSLSIKAKVELRPEFTMPEYKGLELKIDMFKQPEDAMEKELEDIREKHSTLKTAEGRVSTDKDYVNIDFEGFVDGNAIKGGAAKGYLLDLAHSNFIPGFAEQLVGKEAGSEFTIQVKFPDEYHDETIKGKDAEFKIKLNEIKERVLPELDDELAKKVGKFENVDALKADVQKYLDSTEKAENDKRATVVLFDKLLADTDIKIQEPMIQREIKAMTEEMRQRAALQGQNIDDLMKKEDGEKLKEDMHSEAEKRIKTALIISQIARNENIVVEGKDMEKRMSEITAMYGVTRDVILQEIQKNPQLLYSLNQQIMGQKVTQFLLENAKIVSE
ncbi:MAG: trigger factor [Candidatus Gastranaerophilales bacterium]|nr:trigger factor [Candidatus Gastranaerophilales bacterium]